MTKVIWANTAVDDDWVEMMIEAQKLGITIEEIRIFFKEAKEQHNITKKPG